MSTTVPAAAPPTPAASATQPLQGGPVPAGALQPAAPLGPEPGAAPPPAPPAALAAQLTRPVIDLAGSGGGDHVMILKVTPEELGPVTVRALIGADSSVRVELFAPNDAGREALKAVLAELKRDLAGSGLNASLDLSSRNPHGEPGSGEFRRGPAHPPDTPREPSGPPAPVPDLQHPAHRPGPSDAVPSLDVMA